MEKQHNIWIVTLIYLCSPVKIQMTVLVFSCPSSLMKLRTRSSLLESLQTELSTRSQCMMGDPSLSVLPTSEGVRGVSEGSGGFIENFKVNVAICHLSNFENSPILYFSILTRLFFSSEPVIREPSECGAILLRLLEYPGRVVAFHHRSQR